MPGIKIKLSTNEAQAASAALKKSLSVLGIEAKENEKQFKKLDTRLKSKLSADKADRAIDALTRSVKLSRIETAKLHLQTGNLSGAFKKKLVMLLAFLL